MNKPTVNRTMDDWIVKKIHTVHIIILTTNIVRNGVLPKPFLATKTPPIISPRLNTPHKIPQTCTETSNKPYASINDMNEPPRKLLNVLKKISPNKPGTSRTTRIVPRISILSSGEVVCTTDCCGIASVHRCPIASAESPSANASTQKMPRKPMTKPLKIEATTKPTPFAVPTKPLALSRRSSGTRIVTSVDKAIERRLPAIAPNNARVINTHSTILDAWVNTSDGVAT